MNIVVLNPTAAPSRGTRAKGFWARVWTAFSVYHERQELAHMTDHMLADIGLTREEAEKEASKPIWQLPTHR